MKKITVSLDRFETKLAFDLCEGDLCLGVRRAVVLAGLRREADATKQMNKERQMSDPLTIVSHQMEVLAGDLGRVIDDPAEREEIVKRLVSLGKLYLTIRAGQDVSLQDR